MQLFVENDSVQVTNLSTDSEKLNDSLTSKAETCTKEFVNNLEKRNKLEVCATDNNFDGREILVTDRPKSVEFKKSDKIKGKK